MNANATTIEIHGVSKSFGSGANATKALDGIDLDMRAGEVVLLMGPSGSGKTTLLSIMGCILRPDTGRVVVAGRSTHGLSHAELAQVRLDQIGFIFQEYHLFPTLNALQNVMVALDLKGVRGHEAEAAARQHLEAVGLGARLKEYPANLSGGQKQRLAIARALAGAPRIILADEPTAALDSENGKLVLGILSSLASQQGRTVIIVSHDPRIISFGSRLVRIEDGRLKEQTDLALQPAHEHASPSRAHP